MQKWWGWYFIIHIFNNFIWWEKDDLLDVSQLSQRMFLVFCDIPVRSKQMESRSTSMVKAMKDPKENRHEHRTNKFPKAKSVLQEEKGRGNLRYRRRRNRDVYCPDCADWPVSRCVWPAKDCVKELILGVKQADLFSCLLCIEIHATGLHTRNDLGTIGSYMYVCIYNAKGGHTKYLFWLN